MSNPLHVYRSRQAAGWTTNNGTGWVSPDGLTEAQWAAEGHPFPEDPGFAEWFAAAYHHEALDNDLPCVTEADAFPLPPDPEGLNDDRSSWAGIAIAAFMAATNTEPENALSDLLCDLMHWADRRGECFDSRLEHARHHYAEETSAPAAAGE